MMGFLSYINKLVVVLTVFKKWLKIVEYYSLLNATIIQVD